VAARPIRTTWLDRGVLLFNEIIATVFILAAAWLVWTRPSGMTWGFFLYAVWFNSGQDFVFYTSLQERPHLLLAQEVVGAVMQGLGYAGFLLFALRVPSDQTFPAWRGWQLVLPLVQPGTHGETYFLGNATFDVTDVNGAVSKQTFPLKVSKLALRTDNTDAILGTPMSTALRIIGGTAPYHATLIRGPLPAGVSFDTTTLTIGGTPAETGGFGPQFDITDNNGETLRVHYYFTVRNAVPGVSINNFWDLGSNSNGSFYSNQLSACCTAVTWSVIGGALPPGFTLSSGGLLAGSSTTIGTYTFLVKATDTGNASRFDVRQFQFVVTPVAIQTGTDLPNGFVGSPYSQDLSATGAPGPIAWTLDSATYLPPGLSEPLLRLNECLPTASKMTSYVLPFFVKSSCR